MKSNTKVITVILAVTVVSVGIITAQSCNLLRGNSYSTLNAADLTAFVGTFPNQQQRQIAQNAAQRKELISTFKQMFSLAAAAQDAGVEKSEKFKRQMVLQTDQVLAGELFKRDAQAAVSKEDGDAYVKAHLKDFDEDFKVLTEGAKDQPTPEQMEKTKEQWGKIKAMAEKARKAGLEKDANIQVQLKFIRAKVLADMHSAELEKKLKPSPEELKKYYTEHPEADPEKIKKRAEDTLARIKKGEDFATVAKEVSDDKSSAEKGGDMDWFGKGEMDAAFEKAAFSMQPGQTSDLVKSAFGYHIIQVQERRTVEKKDNESKPVGPQAKPEDNGPQEQVRVRHILIGTSEADQVEPTLMQNKVKRALEDAMLKYPVRAPEDFAVNVAGVKSPGMKLPSQGPMMITPTPAEKK